VSACGKEAELIYVKNIGGKFVPRVDFEVQFYIKDGSFPLQVKRWSEEN
jgi:hypothetical protein